MAAEILQLLEQASPIESRIKMEIRTMNQKGDFVFFPKPEIVEICQKEADYFLRCIPQPPKNTPDGEKGWIAHEISTRFAIVYSPTKKRIQSKSSQEVLAKETALIVSGWFGIPPVRLVICDGNILVASENPTVAYTGELQSMDLLKQGWELPGILKKIDDLKKLAAKAYKFFPIQEKQGLKV